MYALIAIVLLSTFFGTTMAVKPVEQSTGFNWEQVGQAMGKNVTMTPDGVFRIDLPRTDLNVTLDGVRLQPAMSLDSWIAFVKMGDGTMMMGDLVLTEEEIGPVMDRLVKDGIDVTAIHNTLIREEPHVLDLHVESRGDPVRLAKSVHDALLLSKTPFNGSVNNTPVAGIDYARLDGIMGREGSFYEGAYQYEIPRAERFTVDGMELPGSLDVATSINFQPLSNDRAAVTGDFALTAGEVGPVVRALNENGIQVMAMHTHMLTESPRLYYLHFWGTSNAYELAKGLRAAVLETNYKEKPVASVISAPPGGMPA
jgi:hypothetical protein